MFGEWIYTPDQIFLFFFWMTGKIATLLPGGMPAQQLEVLIKAASTTGRNARKKIRTVHQSITKYCTL